MVIDRSPAQVVPRLLSTINCSNSAETVTINTENQHSEWGKISGKSKNQDCLGKITVHTTTLYNEISLQKNIRPLTGLTPPSGLLKKRYIFGTIIQF